MHEISQDQIHLRNIGELPIYLNNIVLGGQTYDYTAASYIPPVNSLDNKKMFLLTHSIV